MTEDTWFAFFDLTDNAGDMSDNNSVYREVSNQLSNMRFPYVFQHNLRRIEHILYDYSKKCASFELKAGVR